MSVWRLKAGVSVQEIVGSPKYNFSDRSTCTRIFQGRFTTIMANLPKRGSSMLGMAQNFFISSFDVVQSGGGKGTLTVLLEGPPSPSTPSASEPTFDREWTEVEKPLESHPRYKDVAENYMALVQAYFATTDTAEREDIKAQINDNLALEIITKRLHGTESYVVYTPIVSKSYEVTVDTLTGGCGEVKAGKPDFPVPSGFKWMKSGDKSSRTGRHGKYKITEEWTGLKKYDTDLYPVPEET